MRRPHRDLSLRFGVPLCALLCAGIIVGVTMQLIRHDPNSGYEPLAFFSGIILFPVGYFTYASVRCKLVISAPGLTVVNLIGTRRIPWEALQGLRLDRYGTTGMSQLVFSTAQGEIRAATPVDSDSRTGSLTKLASQIWQYRERVRSTSDHD